MMGAAEAFALERGSFVATMETHTYQAPGSHLKRGYVEFSRLDDLPARSR